MSQTTHRQRACLISSGLHHRAAERTFLLKAQRRMQINWPLESQIEKEVVTGQFSVLTAVGSTGRVEPHAEDGDVKNWNTMIY